MTKKNAVVLLNLGGPDSLEAVEPFLFNLFSDPDIFKIPVAQKLFAKVISKLRTPKVKDQYQLIGGSSPINSWTRIQKEMLKEKLKEGGVEADVFVGMRYWKPLISNVAKEIDSKYEKIILLPLYPHYSITTTGSSFNEWFRHFQGDKNKVIQICNYADNEDYISALNERINQKLERFPEERRDNVVLVFSAHGTPVSLVENGDPYSAEIKKTVDLVMKQRGNSHEHVLCYQSKVGPAKWLEPSTDSMIEELAEKGKKDLLVIPVSFVSDHIETLFELDIEYRHVAEKCNIENYYVMEGLNNSELFIQALYKIVKEAISGNYEERKH